MRIIVALTLLLTTITHAADIYHCVDEMGRTTFSQRPCGNNAEKMAIEGPKAMGSVVPDSRATDSLEASNRIRAIDREIRRKQDEVSRLNIQMGDEIEALRRDRRYANNNLAGAQWQQSLATEMQAVSQRYRVEIDVLRSDIDSLRNERKQLQE